MATKTLTQEEVLQRLHKAVGAMREVCEPEFVVLFGSYAYGEPNEGSDVDVLMVYSDETADEVRDRAFEVFRFNFGKGLEVQCYSLSQWRRELLRRNRFLVTIAKRGIPIFSRTDWSDVSSQVSRLLASSVDEFTGEWMERAEQEWQVCQRALEFGLPNIAAFYLYEVILKWLRALLFHDSEQMESERKLEDLLRKCSERFPSIKQFQAMCQRVQKFAEANYPGLPNPPTEEELQQWLPQAEALRNFVRVTLGLCL